MNIIIEEISVEKIREFLGDDHVTFPSKTPHDGHMKESTRGNYATTRPLFSDIDLYPILIGVVQFPLKNP